MKKKVYLDTCVWCRPFDAPSQRVEKESDAFFRILQKIGEGEIVVVGSIMLDDEIEEIKEDKKREAVKTLLYLAVTEKVDRISEFLAVITPRAGDSVKELRENWY